MTLLDLLNQDGASLKRVSGTNGGEYAGPCPSCGGTDRFHVWPEQGDSGRYWCRGCSKTGDAIQYLKDFRGLGYIEACHVLGTEPKSNGRRSLNWDRRSRQPGNDAAATWQPKESTLPCDQWATRAEKFVTWAEKQLWATDQGKEALSWLHGRGLTDETIKRFRIGWNTQNWFPKREAWGLPTVRKENGKPKKLWLPLGLVIPKLAGDRVDRVRVRQPEGDPRYYLLPGSDTGPLVIPGGPACVVVESELDAILLHQEAGDLAAVVALGSASIRPDRATAAILDQSETILLALDADDAGAKSAWGWWREHYPSAKRWPTIQGKDPSEARQNGLDLRAWVMAGLLPVEEPETAQEGHQYGTDGSVDAGADDTQPAADCQTEQPSYPHGEGLVKCAFCIRLDGYRCTRGHHPDGTALLRSCDDFSSLRSKSLQEAGKRYQLAMKGTKQ